VFSALRSCVGVAAGTAASELRAQHRVYCVLISSTALVSSTAFEQINAGMSSFTRYRDGKVLMGRWSFGRS